MNNDVDTTPMPQGRDRAARRLFGHPEVAADLLRGFAPEGPLRGFDPGSLSQGPDDRVDGRLAARRSDVTWSFALADGARVVLIIEAQSAVDRTMAARMTIQTGMCCENHLRTKRGGRIPAVLPLVFYTGRAPWSAARSLVGPSFAEQAGLLTHFAASCYLLIDARRTPPESLPERNLVSLMIRMQQAGDSGELLAAMRKDEAWLAKEDPGLWRDFFTLAFGVLAPLEFPEIDVEQLRTLREGIEMINEGVVRELEESRRSGLAEGLASGHTKGLAEGHARGLAEGLAAGRSEGRGEGRTEGLAEGQRSLLRRQIVWKFGDATAEHCADKLSGLTNNGRMEELGRLILDCRTGEEFLKRL